jgi:hypothetical protein
MKDFRAFTSRIPLADKTVVVFGERGFANTAEDKIEMAKAAGGDCLYIAWPGEHETHVFAATGEQILGVLAPMAKFEVGDLVRLTRAYGRAAEIGLVGAIRVVRGNSVGVEFAGFDGHMLQGAIKVNRGYWVPSSHLEAA